MQRALQADGEKLKALTGEDHGPVFSYPEYSTPGRILVRVSSTDSTVYRHDYEVLDFDGETTSVFYINEGIGFDWWLDELVEFPDGGGVFVIEGVTGEYHRGDWAWGEDDDESWEFTYMRRASDEEIRTGMLDALPQTPV